ncbi:MAG: hypothetical protein NT033_00355, partial [Candidatus Omnitrophica bacterium]|nr:hypothetical protein [Candidatus Omnitrophota bacterium]
GKPAYLLVPEQSILKPHPSIAKAMAKYFKKTFITAKLPTSTNPRVISFLCDAGFRYIDTEIILQYRGDTVRELRRKDNNLTIRMLSENKGLAYTQFGSSFTLTRFHRDPNIAVDKANQVWIEYLKNYILSPQRNIFVACYGKKIIAVFLVNLNKEKRKAYLFYVSLSSIEIKEPDLC